MSRFQSFYWVRGRDSSLWGGEGGDSSFSAIAIAVEDHIFSIRRAYKVHVLACSTLIAPGGSRLMNTYRDASAALLQLINQWLALLTRVLTISATNARVKIVL